MIKDYRRTDQYLLPVKKRKIERGKYDLYPAFKLGSGKIELGFETLAWYIQNENNVIIDGYIGIFYDDFRKVLDAELVKRGKKVH